MNNSDYAIACTIKKIIKERGLKQNFIANKCGYSEKKFSGIVNGRKLITPIDVEKICNGLNITPNQLFGYNETA